MRDMIRDAFHAICVGLFVLAIFAGILFVGWMARGDTGEARPIDARVNCAMQVVSWMLIEPELTQAQVAEILDLAKAHHNQVSRADLWPTSMTEIDRRFDSMRWAWGNWKSGVTDTMFNRAWNWSGSIWAWLKEAA